MRKRNLEYIADTARFNSFKSMFNFKVKYIDDEFLLWNEHIIINIFGYTIEEIMYIQIFTPDYKLQGHSGAILPKDKSNEIRTIFQERKANLLPLIGNDSTVNHEVLRAAENYLWFYIDMYTMFSAQFFNGEKQIDVSRFRDIEKHNLEKLEKLMP